MTESTTLNITSNGVIEFENPIKINYISLDCITLYMNIYNIPKIETITKSDGTKITIPSGYYTIQTLQQLTKGVIDFDSISIGIVISGTPSDGLKQIFEKKNDGTIHYAPYLQPLVLFVHADCIDSKYNLLNGKRSQMLSFVPIGNTNITEILTYTPPVKNLVKADGNEKNRIKIKIKDQFGNDYTGRFIAKLTLIH